MKRKELAALLREYRNNENIVKMNCIAFDGGSRMISLRVVGSFGFPNGAESCHAVGLDISKIAVAFIIKPKQR